MRKCPLCGQSLPKALTPQKLETRMRDLAAPFLSDEKRRLRQQLDEEYERRLEEQEATIRSQASQKAKAEVKKELEQRRKEAEALRRKLLDADQRHRRDAERIRREAEAHAEARQKREIARLEKDAKRREMQAVRLANRQQEATADGLRAKLDKERARYETDNIRLRGQVEQLSRRLEKQSGEQLGEEAEIDLLTRLNAEFPDDRIERVGTGIKGADIIQHVMSGSRELGRIVYESKDVSNWQNAFLAKAKQYRSQYNTPYVVIVTRALPKKQKGLCVVRDVPVVEPRMAMPLAGILRDAIVEIGQLRLSGDAGGAKARKLLQYILSDVFRTRFKAIAECVSELREQQMKERDWHENTWEVRANLHDQIDSSRREIHTKMKVIVGVEGEKPRLRIARATA